MNTLQSMKFTETDERVRRMLLPVRIVAKQGYVAHEESFFKEQPMQIGLNERDNCAVLSNKDQSEHAAVILDYGREIHGSLRLLTFATRSTERMVGLRITYGESVSEAMSNVGEKGATNDHAARDFTVRVPGLSDMTFSESGFRFVRIELLGDDTMIFIKSAPAVFIYRDLEYKGSFACDDELINDIFDTAAYTCHLNMQGYLWDGIKRDRLVWMGDTHPEMLTIRTVFGEHPIIPKNLEFGMEQAQLPAWMNGMPSYSLWWLMMTDDWCRHFGNDEFAVKNADYIDGLCRQFCALIDDDGEHHLPAYFLDWPTQASPEISKAGVTGLMALGLDAGANLCERLGREETAALVRAKRAALANRVCDCGDASQASAMLLLAGLGGQKELDQILTKGAAGLSTLMSYYILTALAKAGYTAEAVAMMKEYYGGMLSVGATTFWEDFDPAWLENAGRIDEVPTPDKKDIHADYGKYCYIGLRHSFCHGWSSGVTAFLVEQVLGVKAGDGCREIMIDPCLGSLKWAEGSYPTPYGTLKLRADNKGDHTVVTFTGDLPEGVIIRIGKNVTLGK